MLSFVVWLFCTKYIISMRIVLKLYLNQRQFYGLDVHAILHKVLYYWGISLL